MPDREKVMGWLEGLAEPDWRECYSDSEVQETARQALDLIDEMLKEQEVQKFFVNESGKITPLPVVVRCKDCKYAYLTDDGECKYCEMEKDDNGFLIERYRSWDWFCADGERR